MLAEESINKLEEKYTMDEDGFIGEYIIQLKILEAAMLKSSRGDRSQRVSP